VNANSSQRSYLRAAVQEASPAGLVVILYDLLVDDLQGAIRAIRCGTVEECSQRLKHGLLVLGFLEGSLERKNGGAAAANLSAFYCHIRGQLLDAQFRRDPAPLQHQIGLLLDVREAWRTVDARSPAAAASSSSAPVSRQEGDTDSRESLRWSA